MLRWLRWLPTELGHAEFMRRLGLPAQAGGPGLALLDLALPPADPSHQDPELDEEQAFVRELDRLVWPTLRKQFPKGSHGFNISHGKAAVLANLRRLPDGASYDAVMAALETPASAE